MRAVCGGGATVNAMTHKERFKRRLTIAAVASENPGAPRGEIGARFGVSGETVRKICTEFGIVRSISPRPLEPSEKAKHYMEAKIERLLVDKGLNALVLLIRTDMNDTQIGEAVNLTRERVRQLRKKYRAKLNGKAAISPSEGSRERAAVRRREIAEWVQATGKPAAQAAGRFNCTRNYAYKACEEFGVDPGPVPQMRYNTYGIIADLVYGKLSYEVIAKRRGTTAGAVNQVRERLKRNGLMLKDRRRR